MIEKFLSKGKNIVYYRRIDDRPRAQYIHVVREYREEAKRLLNSISKEDIELRTLLLNIIKVIPVKPKSEDCKEIIDNLSYILFSDEELSNLPEYSEINLNQNYDD